MYQTSRRYSTLIIIIIYQKIGVMMALQLKLLQRFKIQIQKDFRFIPWHLGHYVLGELWIYCRFIYGRFGLLEHTVRVAPLAWLLLNTRVATSPGTRGNVCLTAAPRDNCAKLCPFLRLYYHSLNMAALVILFILM